ncbi:helicase HerA-like domain-containing protein [Enhydrobacter sp.]|uniref:helicase HerA-like domain-containing protein n=1 Tax=Enhydrobacter sp. TaxID=1894999 RepID=UPI0026157D91|nr:helicase HerA-like domain-containing protein [Enhydrobacter sp.]
MNFGIPKSTLPDPRRILVAAGVGGNIYYREGDRPPAPYVAPPPTPRPFTQTNDIRIPIGGGAFIAGRYANRHGLITGATGSGKSVTLMTLAEGFCNAGVSTFVVDAKGDLSALARSTPARFLDVFGDQGESARMSFDRLGSELVARLLELSDAQAGTLEILYAIAADRGAAIHDIRDLHATIRIARDNAESVRARFGHFTPTTLAAIGRAVLRLERQGARQAFERDSFDAFTLFGPKDGAMLDGRGKVNILAADRLLRSPALYSAFIIGLLQDIYDRAAEAGDLPRPILALFIDEAHLLFQDCPASLLQRIERIVRLIRSKGVALFFVSQSPADIPSTIVAQLGNRIQHGLRGVTPADLRAIRAAVDSMPANPSIDAGAVIGSLGVGEALVSTIGPSGNPVMLQRVRVALPRCPLGPLQPSERPAVPEPLGPKATVRGAPGQAQPTGFDKVMAVVTIAVLFGAAGAVFYWFSIGWGLLSLAAVIWFLQKMARA